MRATTTDRMALRIVSFGVLSTVLALASLSTACGSDDADQAATPVAAATQAPTPSPTPTPTTPPAPPAPTAPTAPTGTPGAAVLVITPETTGQELMAALSSGERDCIKAAFGEAFYNIMLQVPLAQAGGDLAAAAPMFACMSEESVLRVGVAFMGLGMGGWTPDTVACVTDVAMQHPAIITDAMGITSLPTEPADAAAKHRHTILLYQCMTVEEQAWVFAQNQRVFESVVNIEDALLSLLSQSETDCIRSGLSDAEFAALPQLSLLSAFHGASGETLSACIADESFVRSFVVITEALLLGNMTDDTRACLVEFGNGHPHYVQAAKLGYYDFERIPPQDYVELAADGLKVYDCLTDEELLILQNTMAAATMAPQ